MDVRGGITSGNLVPAFGATRPSHFAVRALYADVLQSGTLRIRAFVPEQHAVVPRAILSNRPNLLNKN